MDLSVLLNIVALGLSFIAIMTSVALALRQARLMRHANVLPVLAEVFSEFRSLDFMNTCTT
jgi:hypothetical protein